MLLLGFTTLFNIPGRQCRFLQWEWKVRQILLRGRTFSLRFFYVYKSTLRYQRLNFPSEGSHNKDFCSLKNPSTPAGLEPTNLESSGEYDNHWTTAHQGRRIGLCVYRQITHIGLFHFIAKLLRKFILG